MVRSCRTLEKTDVRQSIIFLLFCSSHAIFPIKIDILLIFFQESNYAEHSGGW